MKKLIFITTTILIILNILLIPFYVYNNNIKDTVQQGLDTLEDNQAVIYNQDGMLFPSELTKLLDQVDSIQDVEYYQTYQQFDYTDTTKEEYHIEENNFIGGLSVPFTILEDSTSQKYPIIAGNNLSGDNQVVLSSSLLDYLEYDYDEIIGQTVSGLEIVGVYQDPNEYKQLKDPRFTTEYSTKYYTTNGGYTIDSDLKDSNFLYNEVSINNSEPFIENSKLLLITFKNDSTDNIANLDNTLQNQFAIYTNDQIIENNVSNSYFNLQYEINTILITIMFINIFWIILIIIFFKNRRKDEISI